METDIRPSIYGPNKHSSRSSIASLVLLSLAILTITMNAMTAVLVGFTSKEDTSFCLGRCSVLLWLKIPMQHSLQHHFHRDHVKLTLRPDPETEPQEFRAIYAD